MKKLVKSYREMNDVLKKRPDFTLGVIFGAVIVFITGMATIASGVVWVQAPEPPDDIGRLQALLELGKLILFYFSGVFGGMGIGALAAMGLWHLYKRNPKWRAKYPDRTPDEVEAPQESP